MYQWWKPSTPDNIPAQPWLHPAVVLYLDKLIKPKWRALEFGGGGSTLWLAERCSRVVTIEHDPQWFDALEQKGLRNVKLLSEHPSVITYTFDLLLIDGEPLKERVWYLEHAKDLMHAGGIVILDNANQRVYERERSALKGWAKHWITFETNPPGHQYCVTDLYRMGGTNETWI